MSRPRFGIRYSDEQLAIVRGVISSLPALDPFSISLRDEAVERSDCPQRLWPLWPLAQTDSDLWGLLADDGRIESFSVYGLFPATYPLVYGPDSGQSTVRYDGRTRGRVAIIEHETTTVVIKPCQSGRETEIAAIAGELEVGPAQLPTISGFITEGFVHGTFLTDLSDDDVVPDRMREVGVALACALSSLHGAGVCYNDATICDPEGRSHIIVRPDGSIRLIDFGVALLLDDHPRSLTFGDAWNAARTDPMFRLFRQMTGGGDDDALRRFVADYGRRLAGQTVEQIQSRDWRIAEEGVSIIASRFGPGAADALREGLGLAR